MSGENVGKVFNLTGGQSGGGAPTKHAAQHGKTGTDPITPASIGAAAENHTHTAGDVGAASANHSHTPASIGAAAADHTHTAGDVGAASASHTHTPASIGAAAENHTHTAGDVGAATANHTHTPASIGAAAANHSHSGYASTSHTHTPASIGAAAASHTHTAADVGALPSSGGTLTGDLRIKGSGNYGTKINLGDGDYVHISEPTDDCLEIKAKKINFVTSATTDDKFTLNGEKIDGGASVEPATVAPKAAGTAAVGTSAKYAREDHVHPSQTTITGNAGSATKLATSRTIDGVSFNGSAAITHYATCSTAAGTAAKVATLTGFSLVTGAIVRVKFTNSNTAAKPTLNVNSTGAKAIMKYGTTAADTYMWAAGDIVELLYDGTNFVMTPGGLVRASKLELGGSANASGVSSVALGINTKATGDHSTALLGNAAGNYSTALGSGSQAIGNHSIAIGYSPNSTGIGSTALGYIAFAAGNYSTALGISTEASGNYSTALGVYAVTANANSIQLGNASSLSKLTCKVSLTVTSDARDKADVTPVDSGAVDFLRKIKAVRYVFNGREMYIDEENLSAEEREKKSKYGLCAYDKEAHARGEKKGERIRIGVLAQEIQSALQEVYGDSSYANLVDDNLYDYPPEEIPEGVESQLAVNYEGFIPFLIKAVQELDSRLSVLEGKET